MTINDFQKIRNQINEKNAAKQKPSEFDEDLFKGTKEDVEAGWGTHLFYNLEDVAGYLGSKSFSAVPRFANRAARPKFEEDEEGRKVLASVLKTRCIDDDCASGVNDTTIIFEKLVLSTADQVAATIRLLKELYPETKLSGGCVDAKSAFRTIPVHEEDLVNQVISTWDPESGRPCWFVMLGHVFGSAASMHTYNRFASLIQSITHRVLKVPSDHYVDDTWVIEPMSISTAGVDAVKTLYKCLGFQTSQDKDQNDDIVVILGVEFALNMEPPTATVPELKRALRISQIQEVLDTQWLTPAHAGKLGGGPPVDSVPSVRYDRQERFVRPQESAVPNQPPGPHQRDGSRIAAQPGEPAEDCARRHPTRNPTQGPGGGSHRFVPRWNAIEKSGQGDRRCFMGLQKARGRMV